MKIKYIMGILLLIGFVSHVCANSTYINTLPYTINQSGNYVLNTTCLDLNKSAITINADNVVLDGNNKVLTGNNITNTYGICVNNSENVSIANLIVDSFQNGLYINSSSNVHITNITAYNNKYAGIYFIESKNNIISNSNISKNYKGLYLYNSSYNTLSNINSSDNNDRGMDFKSSNDNTLSNITALYNEYIGIIFESSNDNTLSNITALYNNGGSGVIFESSSNNTLSDINTSNNNIGIAFELSNDNTLSNITALYNGNGGISFESSNDNTLSNITALKNYGNGLYLYHSSNNRFYDINLLKNVGRYSIDGGLFIEKSSNNEFYNLKAMNNGNPGNSLRGGSYVSPPVEPDEPYEDDPDEEGYGIELDNTVNCSFYDITVIGNGDGQGVGLYAEESSGTIINNANIVNNNGWGTYIVSSTKNELININVSNNDFNGLYLDSLNYSTISNLNASNNGYIDSSGKILPISTANNNVYEYINNSISEDLSGIGVFNSNNNVLSNIVSLNNSIYGVFLNNSSNNTISNAKVSINRYGGVYLCLSSNNNTLSNINASNNGVAINTESYIDIPSKNTPVNIPVSPDNSNNIGVSENEIDSTLAGCGIYVIYSLNNTLYNMQVFNNSVVGVCFELSSHNTLNYSNVSKNNISGLDIFLSFNNTIYLNNFINNTENIVSFDSYNLFHSPNPITYVCNRKTFTNYLGNYYSDYNGTDSNGDGIGDTPYIIDSENNDSYPLVVPTYIFFNVVPIPTHKIYYHEHRPSYPGVSKTIKYNSIKERVFVSKVLVGSSVDDNYAKELKSTVELTNKPIKLDKDTILVGGPVSNQLTKTYMDKFPVKISNNYPGDNIGVIQVITLKHVKVENNIYRDIKVVLLAGSDRYGTKAAVEYFKTLNDIPDEPVYVQWKDGKVVKIDKINH